MKKIATGYSLKNSTGCLNLIFYAENIVRFAYSKEDHIPESTAAVTGRPVDLNVKLFDQKLYTNDLAVEINPGDLTVKIYNSAGRLLNEDTRIDILKPYIEKKKLDLAGVYGNGERYNWINHLGSAMVNYNSDVLFHHSIHHPQLRSMHTAIPFFIGTAPGYAYGIYFDNSYNTEFDFAKTDPEVISFQAAGGNLDYFFIAGSDVSVVMDSYIKITGSAPLPRKKYLGYQQSRYSFENQEELLYIAENLNKYNIPCDVLYLDIAYLDAYKVFTVDQKKFKNFKEIIKKLKELGFSVVVIINPGVKVEQGYSVYEEGQARGYFVTRPDGEIYQGEVWPKPAVFPDFLRSEVRQWWGKLHEGLLECGVDGIWNDMNEPSNFTEKSGTLPDEIIHRDDSGNMITHAEAHNLYGLFQTRATREALDHLQPNRRPFVLTRAAFAGSQRYAALWTGDNSSVWEHLESSIPTCLNLGLSGLSFIGADVGGFRGDCSGELLIRWTQLGAFLPLFRNHSEIGTARQEPWAYDQEVLELTRKYIKLRYSLITYFYNLMRECSLSGTPPVRPLFYHFPEEQQAYQVSDQFLLGPGLMVCPVVRPGARNRLIYLPRGLWYDFWTDLTYIGGSYHSFEAPLHKLPLFVKAGSIIPFDQWKDGEENAEMQAGLILNCYAGENGKCRLYFDDGATYAYQTGQYSELEVVYAGGVKEADVKIYTLNEGFPIPSINYVIHGDK